MPLRRRLPHTCLRKNCPINRNSQYRHHSSSRTMLSLKIRISRSGILPKSYICHQPMHRRQMYSPKMVLPCSTPSWMNGSSLVSTRYHPQRICPLFFVTRQHIVRSTCRSICHPHNRRIHLESYNFKDYRQGSKTSASRPRTAFSTRCLLLRNYSR